MRLKIKKSFVFGNFLIVFQIYDEVEMIKVWIFEGLSLESC